MPVWGSFLELSSEGTGRSSSSFNVLIKSGLCYVVCHIYMSCADYLSFVLKWSGFHLVFCLFLMELAFFQKIKVMELKGLVRDLCATPRLSWSEEMAIIKKLIDVNKKELLKKVVAEVAAVSNIEDRSPVFKALAKKFGVKTCQDLSTSPATAGLSNCPQQVTARKALHPLLLLQGCLLRTGSTWPGNQPGAVLLPITEVMGGRRAGRCCLLSRSTGSVQG